MEVDGFGETVDESTQLGADPQDWTRHSLVPCPFERDMPVVCGVDFEEVDETTIELVVHGVPGGRSQIPDGPDGFWAPADMIASEENQLPGRSGQEEVLVEMIGGKKETDIPSAGDHVRREEVPGQKRASIFSSAVCAIV